MVFAMYFISISKLFFIINFLDINNTTIHLDYALELPLDYETFKILKLIASILVLIVCLSFFIPIM